MPDEACDRRKVAFQVTILCEKSFITCLIIQKESSY